MISPSREEGGVEMSNPIHGEDDPERGRRPSSGEAAGAVKDFVKDEMKGKAEGWFPSISAGDLVDTPGSTQVLAQIFIFFAQKLSLQVHVKVRWPEWYLRLLSGLAFLQLDVGGLPVPSACVTTAQLLVAPALIARYMWVDRQGYFWPLRRVRFGDDHDKPPRYSTEMRRSPKTRNHTQATLYIEEL